MQHILPCWTSWAQAASRYLPRVFGVRRTHRKARGFSSRDPARQGGMEPATALHVHKIVPNSDLH